MMDFFSKGFSGEPFQLFSIQHWAAISLILLILLSFFWMRKSASPRFKQIFRYALASFLIIDELGWHYWNWVTGQWSLQETLPLHICSLLVFLSAYMLVTRNYPIYEFAYFLGIGAASQAVLTPDLGIYNFPHFRYFQVFGSHGSIVLAALYMTLVEGYRPTLKSLLRVMVVTNLYLVFVALVNFLLGSNYMFIAHKPLTPSLIDVLWPWPYYLIQLEGIGLVLFLLLYLPFWLKDRSLTKTAPLPTA